jgi:hypothetical protein
MSMIERKDERTAWAARWYSKSELNGVHQYLMLGAVDSLRLFHTRRACREWIKRDNGYIAKRKDLRTEPHGWRVPTAVRVKVTIEEAARGK